MAEVVGYGEDSLTFFACTRQLPTVLERLGDESRPDECLFLYRPSFGRKGGQYGAEFGEFDGILATPLAVYPIEAKWARSATRGGLVWVKRRQVLRHEIFQWLWDRWAAGTRWGDLVTTHDAAFKAAFRLKPLAPDGSSLADNIQYILNRLAAPARPLRHVVLVFYRKDWEKPSGVGACGVSFRLVTFQFESLNAGGLFAVER